MSSNENPSKNCKNCRYYRAHYGLDLYGSFYLLPEGHCVSGKLPQRTADKILSRNGVCEYWEPEEKRVRERKENIAVVIQKMKDQLDQIAIALVTDQ